VIGEQHIGGGSSALILGDNILYGPGLGGRLRQFDTIDGAHVFAYPVANPEEYGVVELDADGRPVALVEKPEQPRSNLAVPGLYFYGPDVVERAKALTPSPRGEREITDLNLGYLEEGRLAVQVLPRGSAWLDSGTFEALNDAANYVRTLEARQGTKVAAPEEVAWRMGYIDDAQLTRLAESLVASGYGDYLLGLLRGPLGDGL
jgi:glucose-1-phosphate thymidylyltransferase